MIGCLCIHGFTGSPYEVEPVVNFFTMKTNWRVVSPVLPGHGENENLLNVEFHQWIECVENEMKKLVESCETIYVVGFSMGGLLAAYLATKYPVEKVVLLSAAAYYINLKQLWHDIMYMIQDGLKGQLNKNILYERYRRKIGNTPLTATRQFQLLVRQIRPILGDIKCPVLIVQGECDGIVPIKSAHYLYKRLGSNDKKLLLLSDSPHHVCHGPDYEQLEKEISLFLHCDTPS